MGQLVVSGGPTAGQKANMTKKATKILAALVGLSLALHTGILGNSSRSTSTPHSTEDKDSLLKLTWIKFSKAALNKDLKTFKAMSTKCVYCEWCLVNTAKEDTLFEAYKAANEKTWYDKLNSDLCFISIDKFVSEDYDLFFTADTKSRMLDTSKLYFADNKHNSGLYNKPCIIGKNKLADLDCKEVLLTVVDSTPKREGAQLAFAFVKIKGQYKFCGMSTIP
jgi:hypothetical protein